MNEQCNLHHYSILNTSLGFNIYLGDTNGFKDQLQCFIRINKIWNLGEHWTSC